MKIQLLFASIACLCTCPSLFADTFFLKDGTTLEGVILRQDEKSYFLEVNVTKTIRDERVIAKADVLKIKAIKPDILAFEQIETLVPTPDLMSKEEYGIRIRKVEKFLLDHRGSDKSKEAKAILATLKSEANEVLAGGIKIHGKIIAPAEYRTNAYEIDAGIMAAKLRSLIKNEQYLAALRAFGEFDREYRNTFVFNTITPLVEQLIHHQVSEAEQAVSTFDARVKKREAGLEQMANADRQASESAIREQIANAAALFKAEKDSKIGWITPNAYYKLSLDETITFGKQELTRLAGIKNAKPVDGGKLFREAMILIDSKGESAPVVAAIAATKAAGIPARYLEILETAARGGGLIP